MEWIIFYLVGVVLAYASHKITFMIMFTNSRDDWGTVICRTLISVGSWLAFIVNVIIFIVKRLNINDIKDPPKWL